MVNDITDSDSSESTSSSNGEVVKSSAFDSLRESSVRQSEIATSTTEVQEPPAEMLPSASNDASELTENEEQSDKPRLSRKERRKAETKFFTGTFDDSPRSGLESSIAALEAFGQDDKAKELADKQGTVDEATGLKHGVNETTIAGSLRDAAQATAQTATGAADAITLVVSGGTSSAAKAGAKTVAVQGVKGATKKAAQSTAKKAAATQAAKKTATEGAEQAGRVSQGLGSIKSAAKESVDDIVGTAKGDVAHLKEVGVEGRVRELGKEVKDEALTKAKDALGDPDKLKAVAESSKSKIERNKAHAQLKDSQSRKHGYIDDRGISEKVQDKIRAKTGIDGTDVVDAIPLVGDALANVARGQQKMANTHNRMLNRARRGVRTRAKVIVKRAVKTGVTVLLLIILLISSFSAFDNFQNVVEENGATDSEEQLMELVAIAHATVPTTGDIRSPEEASSALTELGLSNTDGQHNNAAIIVSLAKSYFPLSAGFTEDQQKRAAVIGIITALVESGMRNLACVEESDCDLDSVGMMQQRDFWANSDRELGLRQRRDPNWTTLKFFSVLKHKEWLDVSDTPGSVAQHVQASAYPDRYDEKVDLAQKIVDVMWGSQPSFILEGFTPATVADANGSVPAGGLTQEGVDTDPGKPTYGLPVPPGENRPDKVESFEDLLSLIRNVFGLTPSVSDINDPFSPENWNVNPGDFTFASSNPPPCVQLNSSRTGLTQLSSVNGKNCVSGLEPPSSICKLNPEHGNFYVRCGSTVNSLHALAAAFKAQFGTDFQLVSGYRDYAQQVRTKRDKGHLAATPGKSNHGWGFAIDIHANSRGSSWTHPKYLWLRANAPRFGWQHPTWARQGGSLEEIWHWEFIGTDNIANGTP